MRCRSTTCSCAPTSSPCTCRYARDARPRETSASQAHAQGRRDPQLRQGAIVDERPLSWRSMPAAFRAHVCDFPTNATKEHPKIVTAAAPRRLDQRGRGQLRRDGRRHRQGLPRERQHQEQRQLPEVALPRAPKTLAHLHREQQRAYHGRPDLDRAGRRLAEHRRAAQQVRGEYAYTPDRYRWRRGRRGDRQGARDQRRLAGAVYKRAHGHKKTNRVQTQARRSPDSPLLRLRGEIAASMRRSRAAERRARLARQVGVSKHAMGTPSISTVPRREAQVLRMGANGATRVRCAPRKSSGCSARSCPPASRRRRKNAEGRVPRPRGTFLPDRNVQAFRPLVRALALTSVDEVSTRSRRPRRFRRGPVENSTRVRSITLSTHYSVRRS